MDARSFQKFVDACVEKENSSPVVIKKLLNLYEGNLLRFFTLIFSIYFERSFKLYLIEACGSVGNLDSLLPLLYLQNKDSYNSCISSSLDMLVGKYGNEFCL